MSELVTFGETPLEFSPPDDQRLERASEMHLQPVGTESTVAATAAQLGVEATWTSRLPESPLGRRVVAELRQYGVETAIAWTDDDDDRQGLLFRESATEPRRERRIHDRQASTMASVSPGEVPTDAVERADVVFVAGSTVALSESAAETVDAVLQAGGDDATTAMDLDHQPALWGDDDVSGRLEDVLSGVDVLFASESDVEAVFGKSGKPREVVHTVAADGDFEMVVMSRSERGATVWHDNVIHEQDAVSTTEVDASGRRAAFVGGFLAEWIDGRAADDALSHGVATAALARTMPGALPTLEPEEVERVLETA